MRDLWERYADVILYVAFGIMTTLMNIATYWVCSHVFHMGTLASTVFAWIVAVFFAYVTNRSWVFHSRAEGAAEICKECLAFFAARLATGAIDLACMAFFVDVLHFNDVVVKTAANVLVIVLNYIASKLLIFRQK